MDFVSPDVLITRIVLDNMFVYKVDVVIPVQLEKPVALTAGVNPKIKLNTAPVHLDLQVSPQQSKAVSVSLIPVLGHNVLQDTNVKKDFVCLDVLSMGIVLKENNVLEACV
jgi:hypothetical protein